MIVVTGASGQLGHAIVQSLVRFAGPGLLAATMRDPAMGRDLASLGVEIRQADFENMDTLGSAFAGATQVLLVSSNARATGGDTLTQHRNAIDAAKSAGVGRVLYTSQIASSGTSAFPPAHDHAATEAMLAASGLQWTALRNGFYASSGLRFIDEVFKTGQLRVPVDGKTAWTAHADLADAAAAILLGKASFDGPTPPLTASEALDFLDLARLVGETSGKPAERLVISDQQFSETLQGAGLPEGAIRLMLGYYIASRNGEFAAIDPTLEKLIGRKPISMRQVIEEALASAPVASS